MPDITAAVKIKQLYEWVAEGGSANCGIAIPKEISAICFALTQELFGVFGLAATAKLFDCNELPAYYKVSVVILASVMMALGSFQQWQKARKKYIPGVYTENLSEPKGLPKTWAKWSAFFELLSVASTGANLAWVFTSAISDTGMRCVGKYFGTLQQGIPCLVGALAAFILMGRQMYAYYDHSAVVTWPYTVSIGYTLGAYCSTAFPLILELFNGGGNFIEGIIFLALGLVVVPFRVNMFAQLFIAREKKRHPEREPLIVNTENARTVVNNKKLCGSASKKAWIALTVAGIQTVFNARSMLGMRTVFAEQEQLQTILMIVGIIISFMTALTVIGRYFNNFVISS